MKCFRHHQTDAVGICRSCSKGICSECAVDLTHAVACRGPCEAEAAAMHRQIMAARRTFSAQKRNRFVMPLFLGSMGLVFLYMGLTRGSGPLNFMSVFGSLFIIAAAGFAYVNVRWARDIAQDGD